MIQYRNKLLTTIERLYMNSLNEHEDIQDKIDKICVKNILSRTTIKVLYDLKRLAKDKQLSFAEKYLEKYIIKRKNEIKKIG